jgi:hypothetical protein
MNLSCSFCAQVQINNNDIVYGETVNELIDWSDANETVQLEMLSLKDGKSRLF